jgi:excisionase family DNA binding protein
MSEEFVTLTEASVRLNVPESCVVDLIAANELTARTVNGVVLISRVDLEHYETLPRVGTEVA